jgi:hypothetical protein
MAQGRGFRAQLAMDIESSFATPGTPAGKLMPYNSLDLVATQALNAPETIRGTRQPVQPFTDVLSVSGNIVVPVDLRSFGWWLRGIFGAPVTTGGPAYQHVFTPGLSMPSMVLEKGFVDLTQYIKYLGCRASKLSMMGGTGGEVTATIGIEGASETVSGTAYDSSLDTVTFTRFLMSQLTAKEGGSTIANAKEISLDIDFGLDGDSYVIGGGGLRGDLPEGVMKISGKLVALFENATLLNKAINGTESSLQLTWTSGTNILDILLPEIRYERNAPSIPGPKGLLVELPFQSYYENGAAASAVVITLTNDVASYA